jgi:hypothetical protein
MRPFCCKAVVLNLNIQESYMNTDVLFISFRSLSDDRARRRNDIL